MSEKFKPFPGQVDYPAMEARILQFWQENAVFDRLRAQLAGSSRRWSFIDGPITANNPMGVHHAWGRTYKDIFCRYRAMRGFNQRWQNGFDCQGLWVEVEVEKDLGLNSKRDILDFGLERFARECRKRVETFAERITRQSIRLGQWMRWYDEKGRNASYFTFDDNNIEHIWHFLKVCDARGWLTIGRRSMPWCWRCGTSLSQHELADSYREQTDPSVYFRCAIPGHENEYFLVWTTTPWTLTANTALAIQPDLTYAKVRLNGEVYYLAESLVDSVLPKGAEKLGTVKGERLVGWGYHGPFEDLPVQAGVRRRTIGWYEVSDQEGTGIVHIAPGCGAEDYELGLQEGLDVIVPIDESGYFEPALGWLAGRHVTESPTLVREDLEKRGVLFQWGDYRHRYPVCWRCKTPLVFRLVSEWFIRCDEIREPMQRAAQQVRWIPEYSGRLMQNWLDNMGDWCISRRRFWGLPLPIYCCGCGRRTVVGSLTELRERAADPAAVDALPELHRPWIDTVKIRCPGCGETVERIPEVGDCWLDAGIVPFSTLNYLSDVVGVAGALRSTRGDEEPDAWRKWYPADFISEMREQVRLWFYSQLFMSVALEGRAPYRTVQTYEEMRDEKGEEFSKSGGNAIWFDDAAERMGADPMRWLYAGAPTGSVFLFGYGPAEEVKRKMLILWNVYSFFVTYANLPDATPVRLDATDQRQRAELDRWILARLNRLVRLCNERLDNFDAAAVVREVERFTDELSTWYVRRSRRRFWKAGDDTEKAQATQTLYEVLVTLAKLIAPIIPFTAEELYQSLVPPVDPQAPLSVHLCEYPQPNPALDDPGLLEDMSLLTNVVSLARSARKQAGVKVRQPLPALLIQPGSPRQRAVLERLQEHLLEELNVRELKLVDDGSGLNVFVVRPNFGKLGPRYGKLVPKIKEALEAADGDELGRQLAAGKAVTLEVDGQPVILAPEEVEVSRQPAPGLVVVEDVGTLVALDCNLTPDLVREGLARDFVRQVQNLRREAGFRVDDRIHVRYAAAGELGEAIAQFGDYIRQETLALQLIPAAPEGSEATATFKIGRDEVQVGVERVIKEQ